MNTNKEKIKEIAEQLDCGLRAFIHRTTEQLLFVPDEDYLTDIDPDIWGEELEQLENNMEDYYEIEKWSSREAFKIMNDFANQVSDIKFQNQLFDVLKKNKPFREFKFVIDHSGDFREAWFDFKNKCEQDFVARQLNQLNSADK
jgi:cellulose biosynthesis protein BcsQ